MTSTKSDEYVDMVRQEHPERERQQLAAALWHSAHTRDEYQTKKALLAFKLFPNEAVRQLEKLQFTELKVVGLHFPTNEYDNWKRSVSSKLKAQVRVKPETVLYPWQQKEQERQLEAKRAQYQEKYGPYAAQVLNNSAFRVAARQQVDVEVAILAQAETNNPHEVAIILSQSDQVRQWRASVPDSRTWSEHPSTFSSATRIWQFCAHFCPFFPQSPNSKKD